MKKKVTYLISSVFALMIIFSNFNVLEKTFASQLKGVSPSSISNEEKTRINISGYDFEFGCSAFVYDDEGFITELTDLDYTSNNVLGATLKEGLDRGLYSVMVSNPSDGYKTIIPNALRIDGDNVHLRIKSIKKESIVEGVKYLVETNIPVKAKILVGTDSTDMKVKIRKIEYSTYHILPAKFLTEKNVSYVVNEVVVRAFDGQEIAKKFVEKWSRTGVKIDEPALTHQINVEYDVDNGSAIVYLKTNKPVKATLKKGVFYDVVVVDQESEGYDEEYKFELKDLVLDRTYFIEINGEAKSDKYRKEKFEEKYKFTFNKPAFDVYEEEEEEEPEIITDDELRITDKEDEAVGEDDNVVDTQDSARTQDLAHMTDEIIGEEDIVETQDPASVTDYSEFDKDIIWGIPYVDALRKNGITSKDNEKFDPRRLLTRKEMVLMIQRAMKYDLVDESPAYFTDVPKNDSVYKPLAVMVQKEILKGYGDGTFGPDDPITRIDAIAMLIRALEVELINPQRASFKDVEKDNPLFDYVETAHKIGWLDDEGEEFRPKDFLKRVEAAKWIATAFDMVDSIDFEKYKEGLSVVSDQRSEEKEEETVEIITNDELRITEENEEETFVDTTDDEEDVEVEDVEEGEVTDDLMDLLEDLL